MFQKYTRNGAQAEGAEARPLIAADIPVPAAPEAERAPATSARHIALKVYLHEKLLSLLNLSVLDKITREEYDVIMKFMSDGTNSAFALRAGGTGDVTNTHMLWQQTKGLPYIASAIVVGGQFVMIKDGGIVTAYDAQTGKEIYMQRAAAGGKYYASPVAANDAIYFTSLEDGTITVLKAGTNKPEILAQNPKLDERVGATPAISDHTLYVRTEKHLYAFAESK